jgi:lipoprotein-anchoring transpeptidase ErfK/SrfK
VEKAECCSRRRRFSRVAVAIFVEFGAVIAFTQTVNGFSGRFFFKKASRVKPRAPQPPAPEANFPKANQNEVADKQKDTEEKPESDSESKGEKPKSDANEKKEEEKSEKKPKKKKVEKIDHIVIVKSARTLTAYYKNKPVKTCRITLGFNPVGHKQERGDGKTPEGQYTLKAKNPHKKRQKAMLLSYPDENDRKQAAKAKKDPGDNICIHGLGPEFAHLGKDFFKKDLTKGCIAVQDEDIEELYKAAPLGTTVDILP